MMNTISQRPTAIVEGKMKEIKQLTAKQIRNREKLIETSQLLFQSPITIPKQKQKAHTRGMQ